MGFEKLQSSRFQTHIYVLRQKFHTDDWKYSLRTKKGLEIENYGDLRRKGKKRKEYVLEGMFFASDIVFGLG